METATNLYRWQKIAQQGVGYLEARNYSDALDCFNEAIYLKPEESMFYISRGLCYQALGNFDAALSDYKTSISKPNEVVSIVEHEIAISLCHFEIAKSYRKGKNIHSANLHLIAAARLGHEKSKDFCKDFSIKY